MDWTGFVQSCLGHFHEGLWVGGRSAMRRRKAAVDGFIAMLARCPQQPSARLPGVGEGAAPGYSGRAAVRLE